MLIYCKKCEAANEEDETFCVSCNNALKAIPAPEQAAPWKQELEEPRTAPSYAFLELLTSFIAVIGLLFVLPLPFLGIARLLFPDFTTDVPAMIWLYLCTQALSGMLVIGFSELLKCVRDIAINSYR